jgi:hypothetical protein
MNRRKPGIKCQNCGRTLTNKVSVALGYGPECANKRSGFLASCDTSESEISEIKQHEDRQVNRWFNGFVLEMRRGRVSKAKECLAAARRAMQPMEVDHAEQLSK